MSIILQEAPPEWGGEKRVWKKLMLKTATEPRKSGGLTGFARRLTWRAAAHLAHSGGLRGPHTAGALAAGGGRGGRDSPRAGRSGPAASLGAGGGLPGRRPPSVAQDSGRPGRRLRSGERLAPPPG